MNINQFKRYYQFIMKALIFLSLVLTLTFGQVFPCSESGAPINITFASTTNSNATVTIGTSTGVIKWANAVANQSYTLSVGGWNTTNGTLVELICTVQTSQLKLANFQSGVIQGSQTSVLSTVIQYVFAAKDDANSNFRIQVTSNTTLNTTNATIDLSFSLRQRGYNNFTNSTPYCNPYCGTGLGVQFYTNNSTVNLNQFICWEARLLVTGVLVLLALLF